MVCCNLSVDKRGQYEHLDTKWDLEEIRNLKKTISIYTPFSTWDEKHPNNSD